MKTRFILFFSFVLFQMSVSAQSQFKQTIYGRVIDKISQTPLPGATVTILDSVSKNATVTDVNGNFKLTNVETGRATIVVSYIGYLPQTIRNLTVSTGKQTQIDIALEEDVVRTQEAVVYAQDNKTNVQNELAVVSARTFSVEESQRFAGARNDVSRMASNYAGVGTANDSENSIVIRGNTPNGLLWRLEGIEIPNPNHFGFMGATGGPVSMLNNNVLSNSDFLTGAFPAEYSNALSGVFDLKMRNGNYEKHEFLGQVGFNGFELGAEGPISKNSRSSYLINARYSTLEALVNMGANFGTGTAVPKYKDLTFKLNFPLEKGNISIFALGGFNSISFIRSEDTASNKEDFYGDESFDLYNDNQMGIVGATYLQIYNPKTYGKLSLWVSEQKNWAKMDSITPDLKTLHWAEQSLENKEMAASYFLNHKLNHHHNFRIGASVRNMSYVMSAKSLNAVENRFEESLNQDGNSLLYQYFAQWQYKLSNQLIIQTGVNAQNFTLSEKLSVEPRAGIKYLLTEKQSLNFGYGLHSRTLPLFIYCWQYESAPGVTYQPNLKLDFLKAQHFVLGYDYNFTSTMRLKTEVYYQQVLNAAIESKSSSYSIINTASMNNYMPEGLQDGGTGENYGVELTLEKFMDKGFYALFTGSLYQSKYEGSDHVKRSTLFDGNYVVNFLTGKEWELSKYKTEKKSKKYIILDIKITAAGGQRYTPVDVEQSKQTMTTVYIDSKAYSEKFEDYFRADVRAAFRLEHKKISQEWVFDIQNITDHQNPMMMRFNRTTGQNDPVYQLGLFPMMQYRILF